MCFNETSTVHSCRKNKKADKTTNIKHTQYSSVSLDTMYNKL